MTTLHDQSISASPPSTSPPAEGAGITAGGVPIPLTVPPEPSRPVAGTHPGGLDLTLFALLTALAFLLASFPARNGDLWRHLAAGRSIAQSGAQLYSASRGDTSWLFDLISYGLYATVGGTGLVVAKALVVAALALVLLRLSRAGQSWFLPVVCTALALLAMSTRLSARPETVSCLFLALTLWCIRRRDEWPQRTPLLPPWPLVLLFVIWVNMDGWFVLGLAIVGLVWLGRSLDENATAASRLQAVLRRAVALAILAAWCLLNPSHVYAFTLPAELAAVLARSPAVLTPFGQTYFATLGRTPAGLVYYPFLALGILSFVLNLPRPHWERLLPWLALALLSAYQARVVPFFAVVAGPVLAWNLQSWLEGRAPQVMKAIPAPRGVAVLVGLILVVCAWPGWLQTPPFEPRRWSVEPERSLELAATAVRGWHEQGRLAPDARALHLSPDSQAAFAWFCPEDEAAIDAELTGMQGEPQGRDSWRQHARAAHVNHVILYDPDSVRFHVALQGLLAFPLSMEFPLLYLEGNLAIFGWRDLSAGAGADPFGSWEMDFNRIAFSPGKNQEAPREAPDRQPEARQWWEEFWKPVQPRPPEAEEAAAYLLLAETIRHRSPFRLMQTWDYGQSAAAVASAAAPTGPLPAAPLFAAYVSLVRLQPLPPNTSPAEGAGTALNHQAWNWQKLFSVQQDDAPPALYYIALRAARRALAANPEDAQAYLILAESYLGLARGTRERTWAIRLPSIVELRLAQASMALNRAIALKPDLTQAHLLLSDVYGQLGYLDLALEHLKTYLKLVRQAPQPKGAAAGAAREQQAQVQEDISRLARQLEDRENSYGAASVGRSVLDRATLASQRGLTRKALDMLLESDISAFGRGGMELELKLMVTTGRADDVVAWLSLDDRDVHRQVLGASAYHWLRIQALAAMGEYEQLQEECDEMGRATTPPGPTGLNNQPLPLRTALALLVGQMVLDARPQEGPVAYMARRTAAQGQTLRRVPAMARALTQEADLNVLRGLFLLEEGRTIEAKAAFQAAIEVWGSDAAVSSARGLEFNGRVIAQDCLEWLK